MLLKKRVAILGTGNIGTDLLVKIQRSPVLECSYFVGRNMQSPGIAKALSMGVNVSADSIQAILNNLDKIDIMIDATSAKDAKYHWSLVKDTHLKIIDMTPAHVGQICVPAINLKEITNSKNINLITCGGQASLPIAYTISTVHKDIEYIEMVTSAASKSAGPATRSNIDEYIETTEDAYRYFTKIPQAKVLVILNPISPCVNMHTTIYAKIANPNLPLISQEVSKMVEKIKKYVPGYSLLAPPSYKNGQLKVTVKVVGLGDYLPSYAGNLDIINCAAIEVAEHLSLHSIS